MSIASTVADIKAALQTVNGLSVVTEPDARLNLPAAVIMPPDLSWTVFNGRGPDQATFPLWIVVSRNGYAAATIEPLLNQVADALATLRNPVVSAALPGQWPNGDAPLPAYQLTLEGSL
jgi:hypothetical protein